MTEKSVSKNPNEHTSNFIIFVVAMFFSGLDIFLVRVLASQSAFAPLTSGIGILGGLSPLTILSYLFYPIIFFVVLYLVGREIDMAKRYRTVGLLLFLGGASGNLVGTLFGVYYGATAPNFSPGLEPVFAGLFAFFSGFSALTLSYLAATSDIGTARGL